MPRLQAALALAYFLDECRRINISPEHVLAEAKIPRGRLLDWQARGRIPLRSRWRVADALWYLELQMELQAAGVEQCAWFEAFPPEHENTKDLLKQMNAHYEGCKRCSTRIRFISDEFRPRPPSGLIAFLVDFLPQ